MHVETPKDHEVERNYHYFKSRVDDLMAEHEGRFALIRYQEIVGYHLDFFAAILAGRERFADGLFSVQEVTTTPEFISAF